MNCLYCLAGSCIRKRKRGIRQRFKCRNCGKYQQEYYTYRLYRDEDDARIRMLNAEGVGILSMSRILGYSAGTIQRRILHLRSKLTKPVYNENRQIYELDELCTFIGKNTPSNYCYIAYSINRSSRAVIDITFGSRSSENLGRVITTLKSYNPRKIVTDKLNVYPNLVQPCQHDTRKSANNRIERCNLTLRTHLKRLSRETICFSKSRKMLEACVLLYLDYHYWCLKMKR